MLNRRSLRVKVMQSLFAFQQCKDANYLLATDLVEERFQPDLNSMEVQDKKALAKQKKDAIKIFEKAFKAGEKSVVHEDAPIAKAVNDALLLFSKNVKKDFDFFRKNLVLESEKIYGHYISVLSLIVAFGEAAEADKKINHTNFLKNAWSKALGKSDELKKESLKHGIQWNKNFDRVRQWLKDVVRQDNEYLNYLDKKSPTVEEQKKLINHLCRKIILGKTSINDFFEEEVLHWAEDHDIVKGMVEKTVKSFNPEEDKTIQLHVLSLNWDDDRDFIERLFSEGANLHPQYQELIAKNTRNWEVDRLALTDRIILEMAIAELISFPNIPVKVSMNEYIELTKNYSTPKSRQFINGILDVISKELKTSGAMKKSGRGLIDNK
jgi:transcription antitermination protein NusB